MSERAQTTLVPAALALALALVAVVPRTAGWSGPFVWDDGIHLLEARWLETGAAAAARSLERWREERRVERDLWTFEAERARVAAETEGLPLFFPRPAYVLATAVAAGAGAPHDRAGALVSAVAGVLTVPVVGVLGAALWGRRAGWLAAFALALSGWHVAYSRIALAEAPSVLFATLAMGCLLPGTRAGRVGWLVAAGASWSVACLFQDRLLPFTALPLAVAWRERRAAPTDERPSGVALAAAVAGPVVVGQALAEVPYYGAMIALQHFRFALPFPTHVERLLGHYAQGAAISGFRPENLPTYPYLYARLLGPVLAALLACGVARALGRPRDRDARRVLLWLVLPLAPASLTAAGARYAAVTFPAAALLVGWVADPARWPARLRDALPTRARWALGAALVAATLPWTLAPLRWASGHAEAAAYAVRSAGTGCILSTDPFVTAVYAGTERVRPAPRSLAALDAAIADGCRVFVVDAIGAILKERDPGTAEALSALAALDPAPLEVANPAAASPLFPFEYNFSFTQTLAYLAGPERARAGTIRVHRLPEHTRPGEPLPS